jgi:hypothetical protein
MGPGVLISTFGGFALHLWTTYIAYETSSFLVMLATFVFPPFSEIGWFIAFWRAAGFANQYSAAVGLWLAGVAAFAAGGLLLSRAEQRENDGTTIAAQMQAIRPLPRD